MALEMIVKSLCRLGHYFPVGTILSTLHVNISSFNSPDHLVMGALLSSPFYT